MTERLLYGQRELARPAPWACGPTALLNSLRLLGNQRVSFDRVVRTAEVARWRREWAHAREVLDAVTAERADRAAPAGRAEVMLARAARRLGYRASGYHRCDGDDDAAWQRLIGWGARRRPAILSVDDGARWVVAAGATEDGAWVIDPARRRGGPAFVEAPALLGRWWNRRDGYYFALGVEPATPRARALAARGRLPVGPRLFEVHGDGEAGEAEILALRDVVATALDALPPGRAVLAEDAVAEVAGEIADAIRNWSADVDGRWVARHVALLAELVADRPRRTSAEGAARLVATCAVVATADALDAADVAPGEVDEGWVVAPAADAPGLFEAPGTGGEAAGAWLARHEALLVGLLRARLGGGRAPAWRRRLRALAVAADAAGLEVGAARARATLAAVGVVATIYAWYPG